MKKYKVTIEETLRQTVEVEAENPSRAILQVEDAYNASEYVLTDSHFVGADIALSMDDETAKAALNDTEFVDFVNHKYADMNCEIDIKDKIVAAFGSMDNALYDFKEHKEMLYRNRPQVYLLYRGDTWLSNSSMVLVAPFTSFEKVVKYLQIKKRELKLKDEDIDLFKMYWQTQGLDRNYLCKSEYLDDMPPEQEAKSDEFYNKIFEYGESSLSRGELESLPVPFCTYDVTDEQMEEIVRLTELSTRETLGLSEDESIDLEDDRHSEVWWKEMEAAVKHFGVPYYEDLDDE